MIFIIYEKSGPPGPLFSYLLLVSLLQCHDKIPTMGNTNLSLGTNWEEVKAKIKERNISITDEDLHYEKGHEDELLDRLAKKMNRSKEDTRAFIESISENKGIAG